MRESTGWRAWAQVHNSHGAYLDKVCWLPNGVAPETGEYQRAPWLDEPPREVTDMARSILIARSALREYSGGYGQDFERLSAFQHGIQTVINALVGAERDES